MAEFRSAVRNLEESDFPRVLEIHAEMGMDYVAPDLKSPLFFVKKAVTNDSGEVVGVCLLRLTAETYLLLDPKLTPRQKLNAMLDLQPAVVSEAYRLGIDDIEARIPETIQRRFHKRLLQLGWQKCRSGWHAWSRGTSL